jgi:DNA-binding MarR family transcriptional regulator
MVTMARRKEMATQVLREYRTSSEMEEEKKESVLRSPYASSLILFLYDEKEIIASQMKKVCKNYNTMYALAKRLEEEGLVDVVMRSSPRVTHIYFLSEKGRRVAERLKEIEEFINDDSV